jgi:hypothetical protein
MVAQTFLTTSRYADTRSLAIQGQSVVHTYPQIHAFVTDKLGSKHASFFAEPSLDDGRGVADWYAEPEGIATRFVDSDDTQKQSAKVRIETYFNDISKLAQQLIDTSNPEDQLLGQLLQLSLEIPTIDHIFLVDGEPVLTCWGALAEGPEAHQHVLSNFRKARIPTDSTNLEQTLPVNSNTGNISETAQSPVNSSLIKVEEPQNKRTWWRWDWLRWLLIILAMIILGILMSYMLRSCEFLEQIPSGVKAPNEKEHKNQFVTIPPAVQLSLKSEQRRERELREKILQTREKIQKARQQCQITQLTCPTISVGKSSKGTNTSVQVLGIAFDTSSSMNFPSTLSLEDEKQMTTSKEHNELWASTKSKGDSTRRDLALHALAKFLKDIDKHINVGLILSDKSQSNLNKCSATEVNYFDSSRFGEIVSVISQSDGATMAIADSIKIGAISLAERTPGASQGAPMLLIIVTDASSPCGDPCKVAGEMKHDYPGLSINIVSLTNSGVAKCVADATGGQVYNFDENIDVTTALSLATGLSSPPQCVSRVQTHSNPITD